jgi:hypothetical protein
MHLFKWLIAGIIGGTIGAAVWVTVELYTGHEVTWLCVLVGVLTGLSVRAASTRETRGYLSGAVAAIITLGAIIGSVKVMERIIVGQGAESTSQASTREVELEPSTDPAQAETPTDSKAEPAVATRRRQPTRADSGAIQIVRRQSFPMGKMVLFGCAGLVAYFIGKEQSQPTDAAPSEGAKGADSGATDEQASATEDEGAHDESDG